MLEVDMLIWFTEYKYILIVVVSCNTRSKADLRRKVWSQEITKNVVWCFQFHHRTSVEYSTKLT